MDDVLDRFVVETEPHAVGIERIGVTVIQHNIYVGLFGILPVDSSGVVLALPKHSVHLVWSVIRYNGKPSGLSPCKR